MNVNLKKIFPNGSNEPLNHCMVKSVLFYLIL